jgi:hypothetical protein
MSDGESNRRITGRIGDAPVHDPFSFVFVVADSGSGAVLRHARHLRAPARDAPKNATPSSHARPDRPRIRRSDGR